MGGKNPVLLVMGLLVLLAAVGLYLWTVMSENSVLRLESDQARDTSGKLKRIKEQLQTQLEETSMALSDKKRYISDVEAKFLKTSGDLEVKVFELRQCQELKKKLTEDADKQKNELKAKEDERKRMEEEKKNLEVILGEFKKVCTMSNTSDLIKKLCA